MKFAGIRVKLVKDLTIFITLVLTVIAAGTYYYFYHTTREAILTRQFAEVTTAVQELDEKITTTHNALIHVASHAPPRATGSPASALEWLSDRHGMHVLFGSGLYVLDREGKVLAAIPPSPGGLAKPGDFQELSRQALNSGRPVITAPHRSGNDGQPMIMMIAPMRDAKGGVAGLLCGRINLLDKGGLLDIVHNTRLGKTGYMYLIAQDRTLIMHPDRSRILQRDIKPGANLLLDRALAGFQGAGETVNSRGLRLLAACKRMQSTGWIMVANYQKAEAYQPITRFRNFFLFGMTLVLLTAIAVAFGLGTRIIRPLNLFTDQILALSQPGADRSLRLDDSRPDELGLLARAFNRLQEEVQRREREAAESNSRFRRVFEKSRDPFLLVSGSRFIDCNRAAEMLFASDREQICSAGPAGFSPECQPDGTPSGAAAEERLSQALQNGACSFEWLHRRQDGAEFWAEVSLTAITLQEPPVFFAAVRDISRRKGAEQAIKESELMLSRILQTTDQGIYGTDTAGRCSFINRAGLELLGYRLEECLGKDLHHLMHHSYPDGLPYPLESCPIYQARATGTACRVEHEVLWCKDGTPVPVEYSTYPIVEDGRVSGTVVTFSDISRRKQAQRELEQAHREAEESNKILSAILETMSDWVWEVDAQGRYTYCSPQVKKCLGYAPEELLGKTPFDLMPPAEAEKLRRSFGRLSRLQLPIQNQENWVIARDGQRKLLVTNAVPVSDASNTLCGYRGVNRDITELKLSEVELRKLSRAVTQSPVSIVITDTNAVIEFVNPRFSELTGYAREEVLGQNPRVLNCGDTPRETFTEMWQTLLAGNTWEGDFYNQKKNGERFWEHAVISALRDESGAITHYLAVKEDITEKKSLLEQLLVAKEAAEAATKAKSFFLSNMSHEIRTPMNGVIGMTSLLLETDLTGEQREYLEIARKSGENLLDLINDILDFSKIEAGKLELELLDFDLRTTVEDIAALLALQATDKGLELVCRIDPLLPACLRGDPGRLRQVLTNLVGNAIKFTQEGEVVIAATLESRQDRSAVIRFEVSDTGVGIARERLGAVFAPFTQADGSTTRKYGGAGLGLAISQQLVQLMGGEIGVTSEVGRASTFWFTACFELQAEQSIPCQKGGQGPVDLAGTRVLVVDDNRSSRELMTALLEHWGCLFASAADACAALDLLTGAAQHGAPYQLVLMDQEMPGLSGRELGRRIKADPLLRDTLMVMVTSIGLRGDAAQLEQIGFAGYLTKPVRQGQLHDLIALLVGRAAAPAAAGRPAELVTRHTVAEQAGPAARILLAEDNPINQKVALGMLGKLGYRVDVVANGLEAVRALEQVDYDLVLMDCQMPVMDGFEATQAIRHPSSQALRRTLPIIAMTANAMQGDREHCLVSGMSDYLAKPVKKDELSALLRKWLA